VLQPYQLVKDLRTGIQSTNPSAVLDGDIDRFSQAAPAGRMELSVESASRLLAALAPIQRTYKEQSAGWMSRNVFERQWVMRASKREPEVSVDLRAE